MVPMPSANTSLYFFTKTSTRAWLLDSRAVRQQFSNQVGNVPTSYLQTSLDLLLELLLSPALLLENHIVLVWLSDRLLQYVPQCKFLDVKAEGTAFSGTSENSFWYVAWKIMETAAPVSISLLRRQPLIVLSTVIGCTDLLPSFILYNGSSESVSLFSTTCSVPTHLVPLFGWVLFLGSAGHCCLTFAKCLSYNKYYNWLS